jgi:hypothetical protein
MGKAAVAAPDREMVAPDSEVMRAGDPAVTAFCICHQVPEIIAPDLCVTSRFCHIFYPWNEYTGGTAVIAYDLGLIWDCLYNLIGLFSTFVAGCPVFCKDEAVTHVSIVKAEGIRS